MKMNAMDWIAFLLVVIGGLNWGLVGALGFNLVEAIFGMGMVSNIVYVLVGLGAVWMIISGIMMNAKKKR